MAELLADPRKPTPLVSIERQYETDVSTGQTEIRIFIKFYIEARDSGLLAALSDRMCRTLICLATYMDENGNCHPSQDELARQLGVRRENVNLRVQELLAFRFNGRPVISVEKTRVQTADGSRWAKNRYHVHPISGFAIFDQEKPSRTLKNNGSDSNVRKNAHRPVCEKPNTGNAHTNKNQGSNENILNPLSSKDHHERPRPMPTISDRALIAKYGLATAQLAKVHYLVGKQTEILGAGARDHGHFVKRAAEAVSAGHADLLDETLSRFKEIARKRSPASHGAYFHSMWSEALETRQTRARKERAGPGDTSEHPRGLEALGDILRSSRGDLDAQSSNETTLA